MSPRKVWAIARKELRQAGWAGIGATLGLVLGGALKLALALARLVSSFLYGLGATDPVTFAGVPVFLCLVALLAGYLPARRAARSDPLAALRYE